jgi:hypothetical protein
VAVIDRPRLLEVLRTEEPGPLGALVEAFAAGALVPAERSQSSAGGTNPRFTSDFRAEAPALVAAPDVEACVVVTDEPARARPVHDVLEGRGVRCTVVDVARGEGGFDGAASALAGAVGADDGVGAVVALLSGGPPVSEAPAWGTVLAEHDGVSDGILADAGWVRAVTDRALALSRPMRVVTLTDATTAGGRSRAQAAAQLARASRAATEGLVSAFAVSVEAASTAGEAAAAELSAHLVCSPDAIELSGAELVAGGGWIGLRSHPKPAASLAIGRSGIPAWLDDVLREVVEVRPFPEER